MTMKKLIGLIPLVVLVAGCSGEPEVTATDKANLDRLHSEGIGKVMADDAAKKGQPAPSGVSLANPTGQQQNITP